MKKKYVASISYGKDSLAMLEVINKNGLPLDDIVHAEIMATPNIFADLPEMVKFKDTADKFILNRYGIKVKRIKPKKSYEEYFYQISRGIKSKCAGQIYGWPFTIGPWCNSRLKMSVLGKFNKKHIVQYIGIAADEVKRYKILRGNKLSPLVQYNVTENDCYNWCKKNNILSPVYKFSFRGGCWFCHNQRLNELRNLRKNYPEYWAIMLQWDKDSPISFKPDGTTLHDLDNRFFIEDKQISLFDLVV